MREDRLLAQVAFEGFRDAEVNDFDTRFAVFASHQQVRWFDVAMNDSLLMRVMNGAANLDEQLETFFGRKISLTGKLRDWNSVDEFHDEVRPSILGDPRVQDPRDVVVVHHRQSLLLSAKPVQNLLGIHPRLDELQCYLAANRMFLLRPIHDTESAFAELFLDLIAADRSAA
nr:hypothetical protein [Roseiconus nitratireducens]